METKLKLYDCNNYIKPSFELDLGKSFLSILYLFSSQTS